MDEDFVWHLRPAVGISLWRTTDGAVLTVEALRHLDDQDVTQTGETWERVAIDVTSGLDHLLTGTGLSSQSCLLDIFGEDLQLLLDSHEVARTLRSLLTPTTESIRGRSVHEGLYVVVAPDASLLVDSLLAGPDEDDFDQTELTQTLGVDWGWDELSLVTQPAEKMATSAVRDDSRAVLLNLESLSVWHDWVGVAGGKLILAAIPYVAHRGRISATQVRIVELANSLAYSGADHADALNALDGIRIDLFTRRLRRAHVSYEKFSTWTHAGQFVSQLAQRRAVSDDDLIASANEAAEVTHGYLTASHQRNIEQRAVYEKRVQSLFAIGTPAIGLASLASLCATLMTVPRSSGAGSLFSLGSAIVLTVALVALGVVVGVVAHRVRAGDPAADGTARRGRTRKAAIGRRMTDRASRA